jgi:hypothetical protein
MFICCYISSTNIKLTPHKALIISVHLFCSSSEIFRFDPSQITTISFCPVLISAHCSSSLMLPSTIHVCRHSLRNSLDTPNNNAVFVTDAPAKRVLTTCHLSKSDRSPIFRFFHSDSHSIQSLMHLHEHYRL